MKESLTHSWREELSFWATSAMPPTKEQKKEAAAKAAKAKEDESLSVTAFGIVWDPKKCMEPCDMCDKYPYKILCGWTN